MKTQLIIIDGAIIGTTTPDDPNGYHLVDAPEGFDGDLAAVEYDAQAGVARLVLAGVQARRIAAVKAEAAAHPRLAERYDWLSPAILRFLRRVVTTLRPFGTDVTVCGEMGGRRLEALALLGLGITRLSITPAAVGPIKELVRKVDLAELTAAMTGWLADPSVNLREELSAWADARDIEYD
mgnify:CR=1 FL=1